MDFNKNRYMWITAICIILVSLLVIVVHKNDLMLGSLSKLDNDDVRYIRSGKHLLETGQLIYYNPTTSLSAFIMPGLSLIIAGIMWIFGTGDIGMFAFRMFQVILTAASAIFVYKITEYIAGTKTAKIAITCIALYVPIYYVADLFLTEAFFTFTLTGMTYQCLLALNKNRGRDYVWLGLWIAAAVYFRPTAALFPLTIGIIWLFQRRGIVYMIKNTLILSVTIVICLSPWWIRNYQVFHEFIPLTNSSANPYLLGMLIFEQEPADFIKHYPDLYNAWSHGTEEEQKALANKIFAFQIKHHPISFISWLLFGKLIRLIIIPFYWTPVLGIPYVAAGAVHLILLYFGVAGVISLVKKRNRNGMILCAVMAYFIVVYLPFFTFERYFYPTMFLLISAAALGVQQYGPPLRDKWNRRFNRKTAA
ncbi:ArnT family glycosyltransferase [Paenibacillus azoreducens]|uniref:Glycosyltransferase RgtA/B/C/D-like domain-containing protein n=1 Tax=Paenibacillus azoreducens TaxID=116718 RepID=A0A920CSV1_9BACL|nr:glycosyltransferase family 39 protein [Paenibacillus azoreducens]GIO47803.1 hypothetical protein J34TS1_25680 [Paenibacillus azoreducens]